MVFEDTWYVDACGEIKTLTICGLLILLASYLISAAWGSVALVCFGTWCTLNDDMMMMMMIHGCEGMYCCMLVMRILWFICVDEGSPVMMYIVFCSQTASSPPH